MVSLKFLVFLTLIAAVTCVPHLSSRVKLRHKRCRAGTDVAIKGGIKGSLGFLFKGLSRHCSLHKKVFKNLINLKVPTSFDGSLQLALQMGLGCGSAVDIFIPGYGDILSRLIAVAIRIIVCVLGLLGDRSFCGYNDYDNYFGISVNGITSIDVLLKKFKCDNARAEIEAFIKKNSGGKGVEFYTGAKRTIIDASFDILRTVEKKKSCTKDDLTFLLNRIICLTGAVGNGYSQNLGNGFSDHAIDIFDKYLGEAGCPKLSSKKNDIIVKIKNANDDDDDSPWTQLTDDTDDDDSKSGNNDNDDDDKKNDKDDDKKKDNDKKNDKDDKKNDNDGNNDNKNDSGNDDTGVTVKVNIPLGGCFEKLTLPIRKGKGRCRVDGSVLNYLIGIKAPTNFVDVVRIILNVSNVATNVLDGLFPGVGNILGKIFLYITRGSLCFKGTGYDAFCKEDYSKWYGIKGSASDLKGLARTYDIVKAKKRLLKIILKLTKGKGPKAVLKKAQKGVLLSCLRCAEICDSLYSGSVDWKTSFSQFYKELVKIVGSIGNSFDEKLGDQIVEGLSSNCDKYVKQVGVEAISSNENEIKECTKVAKEDPSFRSTITTRTTVTITVDETATTEVVVEEVEE